MPRFTFRSGDGRAYRHRFADRTVSTADVKAGQVGRCRRLRRRNRCLQQKSDGGRHDSDGGSRRDKRVTHVDLQHGQTDGSPGPRRTSAVLTDDFAAVWTAVEPALRRYVASLGATRTDIDDVVQEVAARALQADVSYCDAADLRRWCFVVARRLRIDQLRLRARLFSLDALTATSDITSMREFSRVEDRHLLGTITNALAQLSDRDRAALSPATVTDDRNQAAVARFRARRRLRQLVGPLIGVVPWLAIRLRSRRSGATTAAAFAIPSLALVMATGIGVVIHDSSPTGPRQISIAQFSSGSDVALAHAARGARIAHGPVSSHAVGEATNHAVVAARLPAGAWVKGGFKPNDGHQPLVCLDGTVGGHVCVDIQHIDTPTVPPLPR